MIWEGNSATCGCDQPNSYLKNEWCFTCPGSVENIQIMNEILQNSRSRLYQTVSYKLYSEAPFFASLLFAGTLFARFSLVQKSKKRPLTDFRTQNDENCRLCNFLFWLLFSIRSLLQKKYLLIFLCSNFLRSRRSLSF